MKRTRTDDYAILIAVAVMIIGFIVLPLFDNTISGRETFFKVITVLFLGLIVFAIKSAVSKHSD